MSSEPWSSNADGERMKRVLAFVRWTVIGTVLISTLSCFICIYVERTREHRAMQAIINIGGKVRFRTSGPSWLPSGVNEKLHVWDRVLTVDLERSPAVRFDALANLRYVTTVVLTNSQCGDAGLVDLKRLATLEALKFNGTRITDSGLKHLRGLPNLELLDLRDTEITDKGLEELKGLPRLKFVGLENTRTTLNGRVSFAISLSSRGDSE